MSEEQLREVESLAALGFSKEEIKIIMNEQLSDFEQAYQRGHLLALRNIRRAIFETAASGSSQAQNKALQILRENNLIT